MILTWLLCSIRSSYSTHPSTPGSAPHWLWPKPSRGSHPALADLIQRLTASRGAGGVDDGRWVGARAPRWGGCGGGRAAPRPQRRGSPTPTDARRRPHALALGESRPSSRRRRGRCWDCRPAGCRLLPDSPHLHDPHATLTATSSSRRGGGGGRARGRAAPLTPPEDAPSRGRWHTARVGKGVGGPPWLAVAPTGRFFPTTGGDVCGFKGGGG